MKRQIRKARKDPELLLLPAVFFMDPEPEEFNVKLGYKVGA